MSIFNKFMNSIKSNLLPAASAEETTHTQTIKPEEPKLIYMDNRNSHTNVDDTEKLREAEIAQVIQNCGGIKKEVDPNSFKIFNPGVDQNIDIVIDTPSVSQETIDNEEERRE